MLTAPLQDLLDDPANDAEQLLSEWTASMPIGRLGQPEEIVGPAVFLAIKRIEPSASRTWQGYTRSRRDRKADAKEMHGELDPNADKYFEILRKAGLIRIHGASTTVPLARALSCGDRRLDAGPHLQRQYHPARDLPSSTDRCCAGSAAQTGSPRTLPALPPTSESPAVSASPLSSTIHGACGSGAGAACKSVSV